MQLTLLAIFHAFPLKVRAWKQSYCLRKLCGKKAGCLDGSHSWPLHMFVHNGLLLHCWTGFFWILCPCVIACLQMIIITIRVMFGSLQHWSFSVEGENSKQSSVLLKLSVLVSMFVPVQCLSLVFPLILHLIYNYGLLSEMSSPRVRQGKIKLSVLLVKEIICNSTFSSDNIH